MKKIVSVLLVALMVICNCNNYDVKASTTHKAGAYTITYDANLTYNSAYAYTSSDNNSWVAVVSAEFTYIENYYSTMPTGVTITHNNGNQGSASVSFSIASTHRATRLKSIHSMAALDWHDTIFKNN